LRGKPLCWGRGTYGEKHPWSSGKRGPSRGVAGTEASDRCTRGAGTPGLRGGTSVTIGCSGGETRRGPAYQRGSFISGLPARELRKELVARCRASRTVLKRRDAGDAPAPRGDGYRGKRRGCPARAWQPARARIDGLAKGAPTGRVGCRRSEGDTGSEEAKSGSLTNDEGPGGVAADLARGGRAHRKVWAAERG